MTKLPIDVIPNTNPPKFRWRQAVSTPSGKVWQDFEGVLPPSCEQVVAKLIELCRQLDRDNDRLSEELRVALSKKAKSPALGEPSAIIEKQPVDTPESVAAAIARPHPTIKRK